MSELRVFVIAGEESGDQLGARLIRSLRQRVGSDLKLAGVGGEAMAHEGVASLFPQSDISLMGFIAVAKSLTRVLARLRQATAAVVAFRPHVLVIIDSPDFTQRVAKKVRAIAPNIRIVNYVSPSVWAWRPGRARKMRDYVDHVLALLPFEPDVHERLGGPPCTFVGHPLAARVDELRPNATEQQRRESKPPLLLVLPGSRRSEVSRLLPIFGATIEKLVASIGDVELVLPTVAHVEPLVREGTRGWKHPPRIIIAHDEKRAAFRCARAAIAASGTVTLELALASVPTVAAYKVAPIEAAIIRRLIQVPTVILANLVLDQNVIPEFLQEDCTPEKLALALRDVVADTAVRTQQLDAFARLDSVMKIGEAAPSDRAAEIVLSLVGRA
ncbi:lipid-A-disaccharide synthase [Variibacter gotjawalensis]|uniref:Lipid-A-disaccharide synthase n=1 Tax=Variibacter gotjawalensis TaxID=1333996 RepID=A0A0S3PWJ0_9BRAD|nr:lipid-A-disaccharide synthase [Variibacter gotjawalensis]NIK46110.1 lipid-A-disaccharide synthase [Variibacter gotjawalensis]RZS48028.1 lipid-A-disaccharide synthase [Variibacter gotjawalensis]BAT60284.1 lipid-A-disaccharide synthase [Variibacter gotjawalensis]